VDGIESLIEYVPMGPRFAMSILVTLNDLMSTRPPSGRLLVLATTSRAEEMEELGVLDVFDRKLFVPPINDKDQVAKVLEHASHPDFTPAGPLVRQEDIPEIVKCLPETFSIGIKFLLQKLGNASMASDDAVQEFIRQL
jgi:vesicle-fusing ATPase